MRRVGADASVDAEDFVVDNRENGEQMKDIPAPIPHCSVAIMVNNFIIKSVHRTDLS
jgi:hypothetical protein